MRNRGILKAARQFAANHNRDIKLIDALKLVEEIHGSPLVKTNKVLISKALKDEGFVRKRLEGHNNFIFIAPERTPLAQAQLPLDPDPPNMTGDLSMAETGCAITDYLLDLRKTIQALGDETAAQAQQIRQKDDVIEQYVIKLRDANVKIKNIIKDKDRKATENENIVKNLNLKITNLNQKIRRMEQTPIITKNDRKFPMKDVVRFRR